MDKILSAALVLILLAASAGAHPGRTDSSGGHHDNKNGSYHYHTKRSEKIAGIPITPYNRREWGGWDDQDNDCRNTRTEILKRDNVGTLEFEFGNGCMVEMGTWICPYTLKTFRLASDIDIDHIVPLAHAHKTGGANWSSAKKRQFANDSKNLIAVEDNSNQSKGNKAPDDWRPPNKAFWHKYATKWIAVKEAYGLTISKSESKALNEMLNSSNK